MPILLFISMMIYNIYMIDNYKRTLCKNTIPLIHFQINVLIIKDL